MTIDMSPQQLEQTIAKAVAMGLEQNKPVFIDIKKVCEITSLGKSTIYRKLDEKDPLFDQTFPQPVPVGGKSKRFVESEIHNWNLQQIEKARGMA